MMKKNIRRSGKTSKRPSFSVNVLDLVPCCTLPVKLGSSRPPVHSKSIATGCWPLSAPSQVPGSYKDSSGLPPPAAVHTSSHYHPLQVHQGGPLGVGGQEVGGASNLHNRLRAAANRSAHVTRSPPAVPVQLQAPGSSFPMILDGHKGVNTAHVARSNVLNALPSDQNWRPAGRMRGALSGQAYSAALSKYMVRPTQSVQAASPPPHTAPPFSVSQQLQILISNNINSHRSSQQAQTRTGGACIIPSHPLTVVL
ncbi:hypothetical protein IFM89_024112 [Coptis chinensis]|uniref:Uncharacterized protein n=1 Tax=Coptis chinensis TaxID=261450 RepID=A0A835HJL9_9MAGN|nr:hypothetical protein IFM89_024112 [Coptis chinensis]